MEKNQPNDVIPKVPEPNKEKKMSAKELALQSMGAHATKVIDLMGDDTQETKKATPKAPSRSQDALPRTLSLIREEEDGDEQRVKFADSKAPASARKKTAPVIPKVVISEVSAISCAFFYTFFLVEIFVYALMVLRESSPILDETDVDLGLLWYEEQS